MNEYRGTDDGGYIFSASYDLGNGTRTIMEFILWTYVRKVEDD